MIILELRESVIIRFMENNFRKIGDLEVDENQHFRP